MIEACCSFISISRGCIIGSEQRCWWAGGRAGSREEMGSRPQSCTLYATSRQHAIGSVCVVSFFLFFLGGGHTSACFHDPLVHLPRTEKVLQSLLQEPNRGGGARKTPSTRPNSTTASTYTRLTPLPTQTLPLLRPPSLLQRLTLRPLIGSFHYPAFDDQRRSHPPSSILARSLPSPAPA